MNDLHDIESTISCKSFTVYWCIECIWLKVQTSVIEIFIKSIFQYHEKLLKWCIMPYFLQVVWIVSVIFFVPWRPWGYCPISLRWPLPQVLWGLITVSQCQEMQTKVIWRWHDWGLWHKVVIQIREWIMRKCSQWMYQCAESEWY